MKSWLAAIFTALLSIAVAQTQDQLDFKFQDRQYNTDSNLKLPCKILIWSYYSITAWTPPNIPSALWYVTNLVSGVHKVAQFSPLWSNILGNLEDNDLYFCVSFRDPITEDLDIRVITDETRGNEDMYIQSIDLYIW